jgi:hydroxyacylglutathione hydrolase
MKIQKIETGPIMTNCYVVSDENNKGFIIDPVFPNGLIEDYIEKNNIQISHIFLTHTHFDHVLGLDYFKNKYKAKVFASEDAKKIYKDSTYTLASQFGDVKIEIDEFLTDGEEIKEFGLLALKTPGHSIDSMCYVLDNVIFSGDTLFYLSVGRSDFPGGSHATLINSIKTKLLNYDNDTLVYPGHGEITSIGFEKSNNPFLI